MDRLRISNEIQAMTMSFQTGIKFHYKYRYTCVSLSYPKTEQGIVVQEISAEEREKRIAATNANPWVQLARQGADVWNGVMRTHMGEEKWREELEIVHNLLSEENYIRLNNVSPIEIPDFISNATILQMFINNGFIEFNIDFVGFVFPVDVYIENTSIRLSFDSCVFLKTLFFSNNKFGQDLCFCNSVFSGLIGISESQFSLIIISKCKFNNIVSFRDSLFTKNVYIFQTVFETAAYFSGSVFCSSTDIRGVAFKGSVNFINSEFKSLVDFTKTEDGSITTFSTPPHFEGAKCEVIYFNKESFNATMPYVDKNSLESASSAWAALIRLMEKVHNLPMKHEFHNKLLEVEAQYKTEKYAKPLYAIHSWMGAGQSAFLPLYEWISFNVLFFAYYSYFVPVVSKALPFTLMNAIPFITTFNRQIMESFIKDKEDVISYIMFGAGVHTILSGVFIFFIGLALRNRFRVK